MFVGRCDDVCGLGGVAYQCDSAWGGVERECCDTGVVDGVKLGVGVRIGVRGRAVGVDEGGAVLEEVKDGLRVGTKGSVEGVGRVPGPMGVWVPYRIVS